MVLVSKYRKGSEGEMGDRTVQGKGFLDLLAAQGIYAEEAPKQMEAPKQTGKVASMM